MSHIVEAIVSVGVGDESCESAYRSRFTTAPAIAIPFRSASFPADDTVSSGGRISERHNKSED